MNTLKHYLKTATRGLWGQKKLEVKEELEAHVLERSRKHELFGLTQDAAIAKSVEELGDARVINQHMMGVHMISKQFLLGGFCASVLASFGIWQVTKATVLRLECSNTDQSFHFSGTTTGKYSRLNLPDKSVIATAIQSRSWTAKTINTNVGEDHSGILSTQIQAAKASFEALNQVFDFNDVEMKSVARNGNSNPEIRCDFK